MYVCCVACPPATLLLLGLIIQAPGRPGVWCLRTPENITAYTYTRETTIQPKAKKNRIIMLRHPTTTSNLVLTPF